MGWMARRASDWACLKGALRTLRMTTPIARHPTRVFPAIVDELADRYGDAPALMSDRESFTYRELAARANQYARWSLAQDIQKGDTVCLMMPNRPEYMALWLGVTRVGGVVALINSNLTGATLAHCVNVVTPRHIIVAAELLGQFETARALITGDAKLWLHGNAKSDLARIDRSVDALASARLAPQETRELTIEDRALFIYTSGTTGLPKAANMNHYRMMLAGHAFAGVMATKPTDRMYDCLPMYHSAGGLLATGALLINGGSVVIKEKFSAREFWDDIVRWDCTIFQYIGEFCRYLANSPPHPKETAHRLRLACGNGLRPDVWPDFKRRFRIPHIIEFYAATEGNVSLFNFEDKEGAVGRIPWFIESRFPTKVVRFDLDSQQPIRDPQGFCIECAPEEAGEVIGKILKDASKPGARFEGYATKADTEKKVLHDVFAKGDSWFRTGDLMRKDADGYFYFVDRIGDTFRWKGENVSTTEVEETIGRFPGVAESNVYGVIIPGHDGRAGMAALVLDGSFDPAAFHRHLAASLPDYARPLFLRIRGEMDVTSTFKQKKIDFVAQGFDPAATSDPIYFDDPAAEAFVRIDQALYDRIRDGGFRL
ncbi:MAG TPA: long-chain-acyl-CoA synthetase [Xanthobacteraceae bacterium]|jgi:fatty-acyl-CoA synthase|nr:long-chain-acyl-CoA synthetase [Xanthobacteraceae bacterium]